MKFILIGKPVSLQRPRVTKTHTYNPQSKEKEATYWELKRQWDDYWRTRDNSLTTRRPYEQPLQLIATFYMPMPKSWSERKRKEHVGHPHASRPDIDNIFKFYADCATGVIYKDDSMITSISCRKLWDLNPRTELTIVELL